VRITYRNDLKNKIMKKVKLTTEEINEFRQAELDILPTLSLVDVADMRNWADNMKNKALKENSTRVMF